MQLAHLLRSNAGKIWCGSSAVYNTVSATDVMKNRSETYGRKNAIDELNDIERYRQWAVLK